MNSNDANHRVLIVDDDPVALKCIERMLARAGYASVAAASGEEAMRSLDTGRFNAVVSDVNMPGMSGFDLLENILIRFPELPVILVTALRLDGLNETARICGASALLEKPVDSENLIVSIAAGSLDLPSGEQTIPAGRSPDAKFSG